MQTHVRSTLEGDKDFENDHLKRTRNKPSLKPFLASTPSTFSFNLRIKRAVHSVTSENKTVNNLIHGRAQNLQSKTCLLV